MLLLIINRSVLYCTSVSTVRLNRDRQSETSSPKCGIGRWRHSQVSRTGPYGFYVVVEFVGALLIDGCVTVGKKSDRPNKQKFQRWKKIHASWGASSGISDESGFVWSSILGWQWTQSCRCILTVQFCFYKVKRKNFQHSEITMAIICPIDISGTCFTW